MIWLGILIALGLAAGIVLMVLTALAPPTEPDEEDRFVDKVLGILQTLPDGLAVTVDNVDRPREFVVSLGSNLLIRVDWWWADGAGTHYRAVVERPLSIKLRKDTRALWYAAKRACYILDQRALSAAGQGPVQWSGVLPDVPLWPVAAGVEDAWSSDRIRMPAWADVADYLSHILLSQSLQLAPRPHVLAARGLRDRHRAAEEARPGRWHWLLVLARAAACPPGVVLPGPGDARRRG